MTGGQVILVRGARRLLLPLAALVLALAAGACGKGVPNPLARNRVVLSQKQTLADGESMFFTLESGKYRAEVTAAGDPVSVAWRGAVCPGSAETRSWSGTCEFVTEGQIVVQNPRESGSGAPANVALTVTKLAI